jgi:hypothetical protein
MDRNNKSAEVVARPRGLAGDMHTLKAGSAASADELREFVKQLKGKNPQEMLGLVAQSGLFVGVMQATVATIVVILTCTVVPYLWSKSSPDTVTAQAAPPSQAPAKIDESKAKATTPAVSTPDTKQTATASSTGSKPPAADNKGKILEKLGMDEAKKADPKANPLENSADDLLKDLK